MEQHQNNQESTLPTLEVSHENWQEVISWVCGEPDSDEEGGHDGQNKIGPLSIREKFGVDDVIAQSVLEELQAQGIVTKISVPSPDKGVKGTLHGERFGGFMVLVDRNGDSKAPTDVPTEAPSERNYPEQRILTNRPGKIRGFLGKNMLTGAIADSTVSFGAMKAQRLAAGADLISRGEQKRKHYEEHHEMDHQYLEIFDPTLGEPVINLATGEQSGTHVTSWMNPTTTKAWIRIAPRIVITEGASLSNEGMLLKVRNEQAEQQMVGRTDLPRWKRETLQHVMTLSEGRKEQLLKVDAAAKEKIAKIEADERAADGEPMSAGRMEERRKRIINATYRSDEFFGSNITEQQIRDTKIVIEVLRELRPSQNMPTVEPGDVPADPPQQPRGERRENDRSDQRGERATPGWKQESMARIMRMSDAEKNKLIQVDAKVWKDIADNKAANKKEWDNYDEDSKNAEYAKLRAKAYKRDEWYGDISDERIKQIYDDIRVLSSLT